MLPIARLFFPTPKHQFSNFNAQPPFPAGKQTGGKQTRGKDICAATGMHATATRRTDTVLASDCRAQFGHPSTRNGMSHLCDSTVASPKQIRIAPVFRYPLFTPVWAKTQEQEATRRHHKKTPSLSVFGGMTSFPSKLPPHQLWGTCEGLPSPWEPTWQPLSLLKALARLLIRSLLLLEPSTNHFARRVCTNPRFCFRSSCTEFPSREEHWTVLNTISVGTSLVSCILHLLPESPQWQN